MIEAHHASVAAPQLASRFDGSNLAAAAEDLADARQFETAWMQAHSSVFRYVASRVGIDAAGDVVAETFLAAEASRRAYRPDRSPHGPLPWFLGIATKQVARNRRDEKRWALADLDAAQEVPGGGDPAANDTSLSARAELGRALNRLPKKQRDALLLHVLADLTYEQVAAALSISTGTVRSRISRARRQLETDLANGGMS